MVNEKVSMSDPFGPQEAAALASDLMAESADLSLDDPRRLGRLAATLMDVYLQGRSAATETPASPSATVPQC
jgi:hypothetical protein